MFVNHENITVDISVKIQLEKNDLESIIDNIVTPFYDKISSDNSVRGFVNERMLHGLKVKQCLFVSLFLTQEIQSLQKYMNLANMAHHKINIDVNLILPYYFIWCDLIEKWLKDTKRLDQTALNNWRNKQYAFIGNMFKLNEDMMRSVQARDVDNKENRSKDIDTILSQSKNKRVISAVEFFQTYQTNLSHIRELAHLESEVDDILFEHDAVNTSILHEVAKVFLAYAHVLEDTLEFLDLSYALHTLHQILTHEELNFSDERRNKQLYTLIEAMILDLRTWRKTIFEDQRASDIHYLDASILSGVTQLEVLLTNANYKSQAEIIIFQHEK